jgi:hypothetical protein
VIFVVPETYHPVLLRNKARKLRKDTNDERWHATIEKLDRSVSMVATHFRCSLGSQLINSQTVFRSFYRPFMLLLFEPMVLNLCILSALVSIAFLDLLTDTDATTAIGNHIPFLRCFRSGIPEQSWLLLVPDWAVVPRYRSRNAHWDSFRSDLADEL